MSNPNFVIRLPGKRTLSMLSSSTVQQKGAGIPDNTIARIVPSARQSARLSAKYQASKFSNSDGNSGGTSSPVVETGPLSEAKTLENCSAGVGIAIDDLIETGTSSDPKTPEKCSAGVSVAMDDVDLSPMKRLKVNDTPTKSVDGNKDILSSLSAAQIQELLLKIVNNPHALQAIAGGHVAPGVAPYASPVSAAAPSSASVESMAPPFPVQTSFAPVETAATSVAQAAAQPSISATTTALQGSPSLPAERATAIAVLTAPSSLATINSPDLLTPPVVGAAGTTAINVPSPSTSDPVGNSPDLPPVPPTSLSLPVAQDPPADKSPGKNVYLQDLEAPSNDKFREPDVCQVFDASLVSSKTAHIYKTDPNLILVSVTGFNGRGPETVFDFDDWESKIPDMDHRAPLSALEFKIRVPYVNLARIHPSQLRKHTVPALKPTGSASKKSDKKPRHYLYIGNEPAIAVSCLWVTESHLMQTPEPASPWSEGGSGERGPSTKHLTGYMHGLELQRSLSCMGMALREDQLLLSMYYSTIPFTTVPPAVQDKSPRRGRAPPARVLGYSGGHKKSYLLTTDEVPVYDASSFQDKFDRPFNLTECINSLAAHHENE